MTKSETLEHWNDIPENQPMLKHMTAIPYKAKGSTYGTCGIRIDGNPEFVDAVMSHLKELIAGEGVETRLQLSRNKVDGSKLGKSFANRDADAECVYIRLCERGDEGKIFQAFVKGVRARSKARKSA